MTDHDRPDVGEHDVTDNADACEHDEKEEVQEEKNKSQDLHDLTRISVGKVVEEDADSAGTYGML